MMEALKTFQTLFKQLVVSFCPYRNVLKYKRSYNITSSTVFYKKLGSDSAPKVAYFFIILRLKFA